MAAFRAYAMEAVNLVRAALAWVAWVSWVIWSSVRNSLRFSPRNVASYVDPYTAMKSERSDFFFVSAREVPAALETCRSQAMIPGNDTQRVPAEVPLDGTSGV
jgi:hypothetical protein